MQQDKLGLPLEYKKLPAYFDALNVSADTDAKNAVIESLLKKHKVKTVLDLTCGTGSQVFFLTARGYTVIGTDFSPALLEIAKKRARREKIKVKLIEGDMRTLKVGTFDAAITIFNAIGHLTKSGFEKAIKNIYQNLKTGGIYVFDILNLEAMTDKAVANLSYSVHKKIQDTQIYLAQCSTVNRDNGRFTSYEYYLLQKNADKPQRFDNVFSLQLYTAQELKNMLAKNGFETIGQYGMDGAAFSKKKTTSILTVARKK